MAASTATVFLFSSTPTPKPIYSPIKPRISLSTPKLFLNSHLTPAPRLLISRRTPFPCSAVQDIAVEEEEEKKENQEEEEEKKENQEEEEKRRKLFVVNLPWNFPAPDIEKLFGECGTVKDVEIIKQKNGKSRGFAFITMASGEEGRAAVEKFDSFEVMGRIIRVEFAKNFRKPSPPLPPGAPPRVEGRHKIYVSNLAWKARATNLRDFFSEKFKPVSARVVFESPTGRSAGYGFVGFSTEEEAEAAISELNGKELMGRPVSLKISQRTSDESGAEPENADDTEQQFEES